MSISCLLLWAQKYYWFFSEKWIVPLFIVPFYFTFHYTHHFSDKQQTRDFIGLHLLGGSAIRLVYCDGGCLCLFCFLSLSSFVSPSQCIFHKAQTTEQHSRFRSRAQDVRCWSGLNIQTCLSLCVCRLWKAWCCICDAPSSLKTSENLHVLFFSLSLSSSTSSSSFFLSLPSLTWLCQRLYPSMTSEWTELPNQHFFFFFKLIEWEEEEKSVNLRAAPPLLTFLRCDNWRREEGEAKEGA